MDRLEVSLKTGDVFFDHSVYIGKPYSASHVSFSFSQSLRPSWHKVITSTWRAFGGMICISCKPCQKLVS